MEHINLEFFTNLEREGKKSIIEFCIKMGFIASSYECPECQNPMKLTCRSDGTQDGFAWFCKHKKAVKRSVRSGTWFQESRLTLSMMLKLAYLWVKRTPYVWIADEFKLSKNTVCDWMAFFRRVCLSAVEKEGIVIGGPNEIVEIDANSFSDIKNKQGRETWVFGGVDRSTKKCFLEIIQSGEEDEILSILQKYVFPGSTIISDNWRGFDCLESNGYVHREVSNTGFKDPVTGTHKNNILCLWGEVKKILNKRIGKDRFDAHLAELMWRRLHQEETQVLLRSFFKILSHFSAPRVKDDPTYISRRVERKKEKEGNCIRAESVKVHEDNNEGENVSAMDFSENEFMEEIEVPLVYSKDSLSEDEFEAENGNQHKRQRTVESLDT